MNENTARVRRRIAIAAFPRSMRIFLPKNTSKIRPMIEVMKLTMPIKAVTNVAVKLSPLKIIFE